MNDQIYAFQVYNLISSLDVQKVNENNKRILRLQPVQNFYAIKNNFVRRTDVSYSLK